ncbi:hypothetical protein K1719_006204 [Acacia pycnantha]|nr:hypothetical protein K1719_006204 [Acacia pycnantha]
MEPVNTWFKTYVEPYLNDIVFEHIVARNDLVPEDLANYILLVMQNFQTLRDAQNFERANPLLVNLYPYFAYASHPKNIRLDYAQFSATDIVVRQKFWAMQNVGFANVDVVVSENGWPFDGNGDLTTVSLASTYSQHFVRRIASQRGTPKRPSFIEGFVFAMFNENMKPAGVKQHFGFFMRPVYPV